MKCPGCNGTGEINILVANRPQTITCPVCNGTGETKEEKKGRKEKEKTE